MNRRKISKFLEQIDWFCISPASESKYNDSEINACRWLVFKKPRFLRSYFLVNFHYDNLLEDLEENFQSLIYRVDFNEDSWMHRVSGAMYFSEKFGRGEIVSTQFLLSDWEHPNNIFEEARSQYIFNHSPENYERIFTRKHT